MKQLQKDTSIREIILSGGDPLSLSDNKLTELLNKLALIPHLKCIRIHSRYPIVAPERITPQLLVTLKKCPIQIILVLHINHANEINSTNDSSLKQLHQQGILLFNQSVLLKGINDSVIALTQLSEKLIAYHIIPYYLHCLDPVSGSAHFELKEHAIKNIYQQLREILPGYMLPRLVREIAGKKSKTAICY
jgi:KamA family protein